MKVLSLFNGIGCGHQAFKELGIEVERYVSYEIDKHPNAIARYNFPDDEYHGDVTTADFTEYEGFDWVMGGPPCQSFSVAGRQEGFKDPRGMLIFDFIRAVREVRPKYFLMENVAMKKGLREYITKHIGIEPFITNAALLSAQNRKRCYWVGVRQDDGTYKSAEIAQPEDLGILLKDVLVSGDDLTSNDKSYAMTASYNGAVPWNTVERKQRTMIAEKLEQQASEHLTHPFTKERFLNKSLAGSVRDGELQTEPILKVPEATQKGFCEVRVGECVDLTQPNSKTRRGRSMTDKSNCVMTGNQYYQFMGVAQRGRCGEDGSTEQQIEGRDDGKANCVTTVSKDSMVCSPVQLGHISNTNSQANRVYSVKGKSVCLQAVAGGGGAKTGLYKLDLPDGDYIIRKLFPVEAEALQTLPPNFTAMGDYGEGDKRHHGIMEVAATNRYKAIGNGWCVAVIVHILKEVLKNDRD